MNMNFKPEAVKMSEQLEAEKQLGSFIAKNEKTVFNMEGKATGGRGHNENLIMCRGMSKHGLLMSTNGGSPFTLWYTDCRLGTGTRNSRAGELKVVILDISNPELNSLAECMKGDVATTLYRSGKKGENTSSAEKLAVLIGQASKIIVDAIDDESKFTMGYIEVPLASLLKEDQ